MLVTIFIGCDSRTQRQWDQSDNWISAIFDPLMPPTPSEAARDMFDVYDADIRRRSIALISASPFGGEAPYLRAYRLLIDDPDATVRAACAQALGLHGNVQDVPILLPLMDDSNEFVRWQTARALEKIHDRQAVEPLLDMLVSDDNADARSSAAYALGQYPQSQVFDTLVGALNDSNFQVVDSSARSLYMITGTYLGTNPRDWLEWAETNRGSMFANQQLYTYEPYWEPKGFFWWVTFWKDYSKPSPRIPAGYDPSTVQREQQPRDENSSG